MVEQNSLLKAILQSYLSLPRLKLYDAKIKSYVDQKVKQATDDEGKDVTAIVVALDALTARIEKLEQENIQLHTQVDELEVKVIEAIELTEENAITAESVAEAFNK